MELRGRPGTIDYAKIEALYKQGHSDSEISKIVGCSRTTVRRWRDKNNVPPFGGTRQTTTKSVTDRKRTKKPTKKVDGDHVKNDALLRLLRWLPVTGPKLPPPHETVLLSLADETVVAGWRSTFSDHQWMCNGGTVRRRYGKNVTHWMRKPTGVKEEKA